MYPKIWDRVNSKSRQFNTYSIKVFNLGHVRTDDVFVRTSGHPAEFRPFRSSKSSSKALLTKHKTAFVVFILWFLDSAEKIKAKKATDEAPSGGDVSPIHQFSSLLYTGCFSLPWTIDSKVLYISNALVWIKHVIKHLDRNNSQGCAIMCVISNFLKKKERDSLGFYIEP